jgi:formamidopyrimidine-DNA glycosylase
MPELPEVETIKNQLSPEIIGEKIIATFQNSLTFRGKSLPNLAVLENEIILNVTRRNKYLIIITTNYYLLIHLGMSGQLLVVKEIPLQKHIHIHIYFKNKILYYQDTRRFGMINLYLKNDYSSINLLPPLSKLGIEPLSEDFTLEYLNNLIFILSNKKLSAKKFIMDGSYICGVGNIYANEILFLSKIHPEELIQNISLIQISNMYKYIKKVLAQAIEMGGSTISDFIHINGTKGSMQDYYYVYGKENQPCKTCNNLILRIKQNGRSSFFCSHCQIKTENIN